MYRVLLCGAMLVGALLISGCAANSLSEAEQKSMAAAASAPAKLRPGDKIQNPVYGEDKLSGDYQVDQSGQISLPLAGTITAQDLTQAELDKRWPRNFAANILKIQRSPLRLRRSRHFT